MYFRVFTIFLSNKMSGGGGLVTKSCATLASQAPLSMGFSKQEYWSRLPFLEDSITG